MTLYAIDWGDGTSIRVGPDRAYAEQLLREASGPFLAKNPAPRVVEVPDPAQPSLQEKPMTMTAPTPAEFLASTEPDEDETVPHPIDHPLYLIAQSLQRMADAAAGQPVTAVLDSAPCVDCAEHQNAADSYREQLVEMGNSYAVAVELVEQIEGIVKKSTSKVSLEVKAAIESWRSPELPEEPATRPCCPSAEGGPHHDDCPAGSGDPAPEGHIGKAEREQMLAGESVPAAQPEPDADVWQWRTYAKALRGATGESSIDTMNRSQIRTMLGVEQPVTAVE